MVILHEATQAFMPEFNVFFLQLAFHNSHIDDAIHILADQCCAAANADIRWDGVGF